MIKDKLLLKNVKNAVMNSNSCKPLTNRQYKVWEHMMVLGRKVFHCHQLPDRSFHFRNMQFPVCARCTGILIGLLIVGPLFCSFFNVNMFISFLLISFMLVDGFTQLSGMRKSDNFLRLVTGIGFGYAIVSFITHIIQMSVMLIQS